MSKRLSFSIAVNLLTENFKKGTNTVKNSLRSMQMQVLTFAAALGAGGLGLSGFISRFRDVARETSRVLTALKNVSGGTAQFADNLRFLNGLADKYGLGINTMTNAYAKFTASATNAGVSIENQKKIFESVSRANSAFALSGEESSGVFLALSQMMGKGKISSEELRKQMGEKLPVAMAAMAMAAGTTIGGLEPLLKQGKLMSADILPKFADALNEIIPNVDTNNLEASLNRLSNAFNKIVDSSGFQNKYKALIDGLTTLLESASKNIQNIIVGIIAAIGFVVTRGLTKIYQGHVSTGNMIVANAEAVRKKMIASAQSRIIAENKLEDLKLQHAQATGAKQVQLANQIEKQKQLVSAKTVATNKLHEEAKALNAQVSAAKANTYWGRAYLGMNVAAKKLMASIKSMWNSFAPAIIISGLIAIGGYLKNLYDETKRVKNIFSDYKKEAENAGNNNQEIKNLQTQLSIMNDKKRGVKDIQAAQNELNKLLGVEGKNQEELNKLVAKRVELLVAAAKADYYTRKSLEAEDKRTEIYTKYGGEEGLNKALDKREQNLSNMNPIDRWASNLGKSKGLHNSFLSPQITKDVIAIEQYNKVIKDADSALEEYRNQANLLQPPNIPTTPTGTDKTTNKRLEALRKLDEADRQRQIDKLSFDNEMRQKSINNMEDGFQKEAAQLRLNYDKELQTIEEYKKKIAKDQLDYTKNQFLGNGGDPKNFESYLQSVNLESILPEGLKPSDVEEQVAQLMNAANAGFNAGQTRLDKDIATFMKRERLQFASQLDQQLDDIKSNYAERLNVAKGNAVLTKQILDNQAKETEAAVLQSVNRQLEFEMQYNQKVKELLSDRYFLESDKRQASLEQEIKDQKNIFNNLEKQVLNDPNNDELARQLKNAFIQLKLLNKELEKTKLEKLREIFSGASEIFSSIRSTLGDFGVEFSENINKALDGIGQTLDGLESIDVTQPVSAITGSLKALGGIAKTITGIFGGADYTAYNNLKERYEDLLDIWDELIDKKKEYLSTSVADEVNRVERETLELIDKQSDAVRKLAQARLEAGKSTGSHSIAYRMWDSKHNRFDGMSWKQVAGDISSQLGIPFDRMSDMLNMTADQLVWLRDNYSGLWSVMDSDFRGYLEQLIQYGDQAIEVIEQAKEALTGMSFDSLKDSFLNTLSDMDSEAKDFADDFSSYLQKAILKAMLDKSYAKRLEDWYDSFADANREGGINTNEYDKLQQDWNNIVNDALAEREKLKELFGWDSSGSTSQEASKGYSVSMDQDTGDKILGRITSIQMSGIKMEGLLSAISLDTANALKQITSISGEMMKQTNILNNIYQVQRNSFFEIEGTGKYLKGMNDKLQNIETHTKGLE
jgi:tape measure domain-containing protein